MDKQVRFETSGALGILTLANPPLNLFSEELIEDLRGAVNAAKQTPLRALLVRAEGKINQLSTVPNGAHGPQGDGLTDFHGPLPSNECQPIPVRAVDELVDVWARYVAELAHLASVMRQDWLAVEFPGEPAGDQAYGHEERQQPKAKEPSDAAKDRGRRTAWHCEFFPWADRPRSRQVRPALNHHRRKETPASS